MPLLAADPKKPHLTKLLFLEYTSRMSSIRKIDMVYKIKIKMSTERIAASSVRHAPPTGSYNRT
uniref:AlNc14C23G2361 protein n=1 Tax=Albugo laibachii Nc14 TaxID=890382 RepID=F0W662_9STRA|nr:AlNc14C23G2361 [Albugo laibachii Nc14]|eukprot:CCA16604.1 AlNc14C23G2361 [Albugo laibachii Nc14]